MAPSFSPCGHVLRNPLCRKLNAGKNGIRADVGFEDNAVCADVANLSLWQKFSRPRSGSDDYVCYIVDGADFVGSSVFVLDTLDSLPFRNRAFCICLALCIFLALALTLNLTNLHNLCSFSDVNTSLLCELCDRLGEVPGVYLSCFRYPWGSHLFVMCH